MKRLREYHRKLNRILNDERMNPNRALFAVVLAMWTDAENEHEKGIMEQALRMFCAPNRIKWGDDGDSPLPVANGAEREATNDARELFSMILNTQREKNATEDNG